MIAKRSLLLPIVWAMLCQLGCAADPPPYKLEVVQGTVVSFQKDVLTIQPSEAKAKPLALHITGTSKLSVAGAQSRDNKMYMTQRDTEAKSLEEKQPITAIYAVLKGEHILLSAIVVN